MADNANAFAPDPIDMENWYDKLKNYIFPTCFMSLTQDDANAITRAYEAVRLLGYQKAREQFNQELVEKLKKLARKVQKVIDEIDPQQQGVFCKLSTRSAKDYALRAPKTLELLKAELKGVSENDEINQIIAIIRTMSKCLRVNTGEEMVESFVSSERIYQDLISRTVKCSEGEFVMKVVIRKWIDIDPALEFRAFVHNGQLNGITQYYKACYVPKITEMREQIEQDLVQFWNTKLKKRIDVESYVMDLVWTPTKVYLIELNHWGKTVRLTILSRKLPA